MTEQMVIFSGIIPLGLGLCAWWFWQDRWYAWAVGFVGLAGASFLAIPMGWLP